MIKMIEIKNTPQWDDGSFVGGHNKAFSKCALQKIVKSLNQYFLYI